MLKYVVLINCMLEISCLINIVGAIAGKKGKSKKNIQYIITAIIIALSTYINFYNGNKILQLFYYIGLLGIIKTRYGMNTIDTISYSILAFLIVGAIELLIYIPYNLICFWRNIKDDFSFIIVIIVFLICYAANKKEKIAININWGDICKKKINIQFLIIFSVLLIVFIISLIKFDEGMSLEQGTYLSAALFMFFYFVYKINAYRLEIKYHKMYSEKYGEIITELRERQHKYMNQIDSVYALCKIYDNYDELVCHQAEELNQLKQYLMPGKLLILERPLVMAHIYTKLCEASEKQIEIHTDFSCSLEKTDIPDIFLIEIIGNLLDNAMDEVSARKKHEKIRIKIANERDGICISVGNEHERIPYEEYSQFFVDGYSAKGETRGVGLPYVKKIVDKYHGYIEIGNVLYSDVNYFVVSVLIKK